MHLLVSHELLMFTFTKKITCTSIVLEGGKLCYFLQCMVDTNCMVFMTNLLKLNSETVLINYTDSNTMRYGDASIGK
jgi:hypothetical protein